MTRDEIAAIVTAIGSAGVSVSEGDVALALLDVDVAALKAQAASLVQWQLWDKVSPINGVSAGDIIRARNDIADADQVYLILIDGRVTYIQPHAPGVEGHVLMSTAEVGEIARAHTAEILAAVELDLIAVAVRERVTGVTPGGI